MRIPKEVEDEILKAINGEDSDWKIPCKWCLDNEISQKEAFDLLGCVVYEDCLKRKNGVDARELLKGR